MLIQKMRKNGGCYCGAGEGKTLVVIAHKLPAIMNADQICVMDHGKMVATGKHQELMFALISRILNLSGRYKSRIQAAFLCAFVESILSKMPIFMAFIVLAGFADNTLTGKTCLFVGLGLLAAVVVQTVVHYLSDRLQSAAGFMIFADKRMELGNHLRKMPMGYFTSGNIGKISSVLSTDMVFIEEVSMSTIGNMIAICCLLWL